MIKVENIETWGFEHAIRGARNPMNSHAKSDSGYGIDGEDEDVFVIGKNDMDLMQRLYKAGTEHRKYLRQIFVSMDITAPLYWWKQMDQFRINVTTNSCSTMHKIHSKEFDLDDFSHEHMTERSLDYLQKLIDHMNVHRGEFNALKMKEDWWQMIQLLPSSYNQKRTITMNYENVMNIINQRTGHKLDEWNEFVGILRKLPYVNEIRSDS